MPPSAVKSEPKADAKADDKPTESAQSKPDAKAETEPKTKTEPKPEVKAKTPADLTLQLVKRVHALYEELGRKDLQAVEDLEKADRDNRTDKTKTDAKPEDKVKPGEGAQS